MSETKSDSVAIESLAPFDASMICFITTNLSDVEVAASTAVLLAMIAEVGDGERAVTRPSWNRTRLRSEIGILPWQRNRA